MNDLHSPLMGLWEQIIDHPTAIAKEYERIWVAQLGDERAYYDKVRDRFNKHHHPADFLYLLARCVKAAIRYNARGEFNNSPDNRRLGANPATMRRHILGASVSLRNCTALSNRDYREVLADAKSGDIVYMDPPYQGVVATHNHRYRHGIVFDEFVDSLDDLIRRRVPFIVSYDGRTGTKVHGRPLPEALGLQHVELAAGRSTQATLLGRSACTYESLYLSPALKVDEAWLRQGSKNGGGQGLLFSEAV